MTPPMGSLEAGNGNLERCAGDKAVQYQAAKIIIKPTPHLQQSVRGVIIRGDYICPNNDLAGRGADVLYAGASKDNDTSYGYDLQSEHSSANDILSQQKHEIQLSIKIICEKIEKIHQLALDILKNPKKNKKFQFGQERVSLKRALKELKFGSHLIEQKTNIIASEEIKFNIESALSAVKRKYTRSQVMGFLTSVQKVMVCAVNMFAIATSPLFLICKVVSLASSSLSFLLQVDRILVRYPKQDIIKQTTDNNFLALITEDKQRRFRDINRLVLDILCNASKRKNFSYGKETISAKDAKKILQLGLQELRNIAAAIPSASQGSKKYQDLLATIADAETALGKVEREIKVERIKTITNLLCASIATIGAILCIVVTLGPMTPLVISGIIIAWFNLINAAASLKHATVQTIKTLKM